MTTASGADIDPARRSRLLAVKLAALVRDHAGEAPIVPGTFPGGAALVRNGEEAWMLLEERPERGLGPAMAWARQQGATSLHVAAEDGTGVLARRAAEFDPAPQVWRVDGRELHPAEPTPPAEAGPVDPELLELATLIEAGGAEPLVEHGVLVGEVHGLEVCRAVRDPHTGVPRLEVGVGAHDREAFALLHGDVPTEESLARVVAAVATHRRPDADPHPLNRLGAERALRSRLRADPSLVGLTHLASADPPVPRTNLKDPVPCVAVGLDAQGMPAVVVCSVGIDLDVVPFAADARLARLGGGQPIEDGGVTGGVSAGDLIIAVPERDAHPVTQALVASLRRPARLAAIAPA